MISEDPGPNWYDFGMGAGTMVFLILIKILNDKETFEWCSVRTKCFRRQEKQNFKCAKTVNSERVQNNCFLKNLIWFLSTAKMSIVLIIMMVIAALTESPEQIENFLGGCITGNRDPLDKTGQNCTTLTLTKIKDVPPPIFTPPAFGGFNYEFCNEFSKDEDGDEIRLYNSKPRYPEGFKLQDHNFTSVDCKEGETEDVWFVSFGDMMSQLGAGIIIQPIVSFLQHIALAKSFSKKPPQYQVDTTQVQIRVEWTRT